MNCKLCGYDAEDLCKQITDLEAKLAEKECLLNIKDGELNNVHNLWQNKIDEVKQLKQQLAEKDEELEEQLKNANVPKFKIGQEVWFVRYFNAGCYEFDYGKVIQIKITEYDGIFYEMEYLNKCEIDFRSRHEKYVFATKEEAVAKLKEIRRK